MSISAHDTYFAGCSDRFTPPAIATAHSPAARLCAARCTATSDDEHAVSIATLGPWKSQTYDTRFATGARLTASGVGAPASASRWISAYSLCITPTNTPTGAPASPPPGARRASVSGVWPASSIAAHAVSRNTRSCGSITSASRGVIRKKRASKQSGASMKPPHRDTGLPDGERTCATSSARQRSAGTSVTQSRPSRRFAHNSSRSRAPG